MQELIALAFSDVTEALDPNGRILPLNEMPKNVAKSIEFKTNFRGDVVGIRSTGNKMKALELLDNESSLKWRLGGSIIVLTNFLGFYWRVLDLNLAGVAGFEPATNGLTVRCATAAPHPNHLFCSLQGAVCPA